MKKPKVRHSKAKEFTEKVLKDQSIDWDFKVLSEQSLALDILYLLGVSINKEYSFHNGFIKFLDKCGLQIKEK